MDKIEKLTNLGKTEKFGKSAQDKVFKMKKVEKNRQNKLHW